MERSTGPRKTAELSRSLYRQLNSYALVAGAAGVGMLALAQPAEAKIVYTGAHRVIEPRHTYGIDFRHDGIADFKISNSVSACTDFCFFELRQNPAEGNSAVGYTVGSGGVLLDSALKAGARVGPDSPFKKGPAAMVVARSNVYTSNKTIVYGAWANVKDRYLGLSFQIKGETHYGWARLNIKVSKTKITATLTGYAYETIPNKAIIAGKTSGRDAISVQPSSLGHLATGASAIPAWRVKAAEATTH